VLTVSIVGIGTDVAEVPRIRAAIENPTTGHRFRARVYTAGEQTYCDGRGRGRFESYAARFAAKEATMKALGRGWGGTLRWQDIEVVRARGERPRIVLAGRAAEFAASLGVRTLHLALTHTRDIAVAEVIAER
jgi:holo-[acyl-carrier protein] synthase